MFGPASIQEKDRWSDTRSRLNLVRLSFQQACATISKSSSLGRTIDLVQAAIDRAGDYLLGTKMHPDTAKAIGVIWRLAGALEVLKQHGIPFKEHLKMMRGGSTSYGVKDYDKENKYKDCELELHIASKLADAGKHPLELHKPGHPFDITVKDVLRIECKHPSSESKIANSITEFGKELDKDGRCGMIVIGVEDLLELGKPRVFSSIFEIRSLAQSKLDNVVKERSQGWIANWEAYKRILSIYLIASPPVFYYEGLVANFAHPYLTAPGALRDSGITEVDKVLRDSILALEKHVMTPIALPREQM